MGYKLFDIHAHLQFPEFDLDKEDLIKKLEAEGVAVINVGTGKDSSLQALELAKGHENLWAVVGLHPTHTDEEFDQSFYTELAKQEKVVAIGECGIDLFRAKEETLTEQIEIFKKHLEVAKAVGKPAMLHIRASSPDSADAYKVALEVLKDYSEVKCNVHFFASNIEVAQEFITLGHTLSFTGAITYPKSEQYIEVIKFVPLESIMAETDCPFVAPIPYRGKRCDPGMVREVYKKIAEIKEMPLELVQEKVRENVRRVFGI